MARAYFVKKARKDNKAAGIKKGDSYWWWKLSIRHPRQISKTQPRGSQLTGSEYESQALQIQEALEDTLAAENLTADDVTNAIDEAKSSIQDLASETEEKLQNMPEGLQQGPTGELLQERVDNLQAWESELDSIDTDEEADQDQLQEYLQAAIDGKQD